MHGLPAPKRDRRVLVDQSTLDDAGVFAFGRGEALVQTVDFFTPVVDDPYDYGRIAAANALSDVYAMGGKPITALALLCYPDAELPPEVMVATQQRMFARRNVEQRPCDIALIHAMYDLTRSERQLAGEPLAL